MIEKVDNVIIATCGKSLNLYREKIFKQYTNNKKNTILICVKQAFDIFNKICDVHLINTANQRKYNYLKNKKPYIILGSSDFANKIFMEYDFVYYIDYEKDKYTSLDKTLSRDHKFKYFPLEKNFFKKARANRKWGPGIMYEIAIPLAISIARKKISVYGWDISDSNNQNSHYYDKKFIMNTSLLPGYLKNRHLHNIYNFILHHLGFTYNNASMFKGEDELVKSYIPHIKKYLKSLNITLKLNDE